LVPSSFTKVRFILSAYLVEPIRVSGFPRHFR
jgi:hypothetical protein